MRKWILGSMAALAMLLAVPQPSFAGGPHGGHGWHGGGHWGHGGYYYRGPGYYRGYGFPAFGAGLVLGGLIGSYPYAYPYAYRRPYVYPPQVVIQQPPPVYVEQPQEDVSYWYYCQSPQGYYPYVQRCGSQWMQVVPPEGPPS